MELTDGGCSIRSEVTRLTSQSKEGTAAKDDRKRVSKSAARTCLGPSSQAVIDFLTHALSKGQFIDLS